jgi:hypothetical protein
MFQTGSTINPALGRTDYSAYAQGAIAGGQAIGQGIANLGQGIASGIEQYTKQKKENKQLEAKLKGSIVALEGLGQIAKGVSPEADASYTGLMAKLNDPSISITEKVALSDAAQGTLKELISFGIQANTKRDAATATNLGLASAQSGKPIPSIYNPEITASASKQALEFSAQRAALESARLNQAKTEAETDVIKAAPISKEFGTINEAQMLANQMAAAAGGSAIGRTEYNPKTGKFSPVVTQKQLPQVPDPELVGRVEGFNKEIQGFIDNGTTARQVAPQIKTLLNFISNDKLDTGAFEELKLKGRSFAKGFGFSVDETALANAEQAQAMFGRMILEYFQQTKGSISNAENQLFASFGPELGKSKKANEAILIAADKRNTLDKDLERISRDYRRAKLNGQEAQEKIQARLDEYDSEIASLLPQGQSPAAAQGLIPLSPKAQAAVNVVEQYLPKTK